MIFSVFENWILVCVTCVEQVVFEYAKDRPIMFSSFHPDAAQLVRKLQTTYPVCSLDMNLGGSFSSLSNVVKLKNVFLCDSRCTS